MPAYFDELSGDDSDESLGSSDGSEDDVELLHNGHQPLDDYLRPSSKLHASTPTTTKTAMIPSTKAAHDDGDDETIMDKNQIIVHLDIDCFYCQCEKIDRKLDDTRPFAIGQKHIIVTCNYAARNCGVQKLESRDTALRKCPHLIIYEGSDLERYRIHGRNVYKSFRKACRTVFRQRAVDEDKEYHDQNSSSSSSVACAKGSMDEMVADVTAAVTVMTMGTGVDASRSLSYADRNDDIYVYGETAETTVLREDQSGATTTHRYVPKEGPRSLRPKSAATSTQQGHNRRLLLAANAAWNVRQIVMAETGFTTTLGVSTNPQLAKLASSLRKPATVNVLYPSRAKDLVENMPLRGITGLGHRMIRALQPALAEYYHDDDDDRGTDDDPSTNKRSWKVRDLSKLPRVMVEESLATVAGLQNASSEATETLLRKCRGDDPTPVVDDNGGLSQRVSVENSFRRGTVCSVAAVREAMEVLYTRLPRLVVERFKEDPNSYPKTLTLTVRCVDPKLLMLAAETKNTTKQRSRRPFTTCSRQEVLHPQVLDPDTWRSVEQQSNMLRKKMEPLLQSLILNNESINVTRINIALSNFATSNTITASRNAIRDRDDNIKRKNSRASGVSKRFIVPTARPSPRPVSSADVMEGREQTNILKSQEVDPTFLAALPPNLAREVMLQQTIKSPISFSNPRKKPQLKNKRRRIDSFFRKK